MVKKCTEYVLKIMRTPVLFCMFIVCFVTSIKRKQEANGLNQSPEQNFSSHFIILENENCASLVEISPVVWEKRRKLVKFTTTLSPNKNSENKR